MLDISKRYRTSAGWAVENLVEHGYSGGDFLVAYILDRTGSLTPVHYNRDGKVFPHALDSFWLKFTDDLSKDTLYDKFNLVEIEDTIENLDISDRKTLRDEFAMAAFNSVSYLLDGDTSYNRINYVVGLAHNIADVMMAARKVK